MPEGVEVLELSPRSRRSRKNTIRQKIREAKKTFVFLDPDYRQNDAAPDRIAVAIPVSVAQALRIVDLSPRDNPPYGDIDADGHLHLHPPEPRKG